MRNKADKLMLVQGSTYGTFQGPPAPTSLSTHGATALKPDDTAETALRDVAAALHDLGASEPEPSTAERRSVARMKGYTGEACGECGNFTLVRNGTCLKCDTCGGTSGCS